MLSLAPFFKGMVIGFSIAAPVGPVGLLCIRRSLTNGRLYGFVSGLGAAVADTIYGIVAALGLSAVTHALLEHRTWLQGAGGVFLLFFGIAMLRSRPPAQAAQATGGGRLITAFGSTLVLTLMNPITIVSFIGIFAAVGVSDPTEGVMGPIILVVGVFLGSAAWWLFLSTAASWLGRRLQAGGRGLRALNLVAGLVIAGIGLWELGQLALERLGASR